MDAVPLDVLVSVDEAVPLELFVSVLEALVVAELELREVEVTCVPLPGEVSELLREHAAMKAALAAAPDAWKAQLRSSYLVEVDRVTVVEPDGATPSLMPGVLPLIDDVWELIRRAALAQPAVDAATRRMTA